MVHPYPAPGPTQGEGNIRENIYKYLVRRRLVEIFAESQEDANAEFEERFGFAPTKENDVA